ncbi:fatty acid desaturase [Actinokineospora sp. HUAS TT18]|uniref:fatty acid desaturase n=1 Tax=Actinokineospora sp. HUAS TT18 TaxID=3447451 RepID=UPI003F523314
MAVVAATWRFGHSMVALMISVMASVVCGRQLRALECLVHEASHFNWTRRYRALNDMLATFLAAIPTGAKISDYRASHLQHHGQFATSQDPDRRRYVELGLESLDRQSISAYWRSLLRILPCYQIGWFKSFLSDPVYLVAPIVWAGVSISIPVAVIAGPSTSALVTGVWAFSYLLVLPVIRLVGESAEHTYSTASTVFDATISNIGLAHRLVFHPHADGFHTVHHLWPGIPHHALRKTHNSLTEQDPECYGNRVRVRYRVNAEIAPA